MIKPWKTLSSRYLIRDRWMTLRADTCEGASGNVIDPYYVQESTPWVHVVAFDSSDRMLVIEQYRHGLGQVVTEIPCGCVDANESPLESMKRELLEETGSVAERWEDMLPFSPNPARFSNLTYPFIAYGTKVVAPQKLDESEEIEFKFIEVPQVLSMIEQGIISHPIHVTSILLAFRRRGWLPLSR
jgi:ADP-ribose pyrophosphatase